MKNIDFKIKTHKIQHFYNKNYENKKDSVNSMTTKAPLQAKNLPAWKVSFGGDSVQWSR